nr:golgin imh1 [Quercus suber]
MFQASRVCQYIETDRSLIACSSQRLKGFNLDNFLDPTLAEQQNKKEQQTGKTSTAKKSPSTNNGSGRPNGRTASPSKRGGSQQRVSETGDAILSKAPDPEEFVIGDDASDLSRTNTPKPRLDKAPTETQRDSQDASGAKGKGREKVDGTDELPEEVRKKLARLEQLTVRYQGMLSNNGLHRDWHLLFYLQNSCCVDLLRNYRSAHKRVQAIEPFEATLREHTTLNSILDPGAFGEFLSSRDKDRDMIMAEFRRVADENNTIVKERDELKTRLDEAEKKAKDAFDEAAGLRKEREDRSAEAAEGAVANGETVDAITRKDNPGSEGQDTAGQEKREGDFFSYEEEKQNDLQDQIAQFESEITSHKEYITELLTDNASLNHQLELCQLNLSAMENKITIKDRDITSMRTELNTFQDELAKNESRFGEMRLRLGGERNGQDGTPFDLEQRAAVAEKAAAAAEASLQKYKEEFEKDGRASRPVQQEDKGLQNLRGLIGTLRDQITGLEKSKAEKEAESKDLQFAVKRLEAESNNSDNIISRLRGHEATADTLRKKLAGMEHERDAAQRLAESKKGHEAAVASLRSQLKRAERDRDAAYQLIIDCGRCEKPAGDGEKGSETQSEVSSVAGSRFGGGSEGATHSSGSTQPTEVSNPTTPTIEEEDPSVGDKKKKSNKKKKSKGKKASNEKSTLPVPTVEDLMENPSRAVEMLQNIGETKQISMLEVITRMLTRIDENRKEDEAKGDSVEHIRQHLEDTIEKRDQMIRQYTHEIATLTDMNLRQDQDVKTKLNEIKVLKTAIADKEAALESLNAKLKAGEGDVQLSATNYESITQKVKELEAEVTNRQSTIDEQVAAIERLSAKMKDQEGLTEEIETLRESLVERAGDLNKFQEMKLAKEKAATEHADLLGEHQQLLKKHDDEQKSLLEDIAKLKSDKEAYEKQIQELETSNNASAAKSEQERQEQDRGLEQTKKRSVELEIQVKEMTARISTLVPELETTTTLAKERYQKVIDLQKHCNDVLLPKIKKLEEENVSMKVIKAESEKASQVVKKLEARERDLKSEITEYKSQVAEKNRAIAELKDGATKSQERSLALEDSYENARRDLEKSQSTRDEATETRDRLQVDLNKLEQEFKQSRARLEELERQVKTFSDQANSLRDELQLKSAQHASSQSNMDNMQDQTRELATQMKEARGRNASLEDELADAHRLLFERSREAETMRRLLGEVEGKAESRVKEMRERMDMAVEERDRAEDEASSIGRRKAREIEDFKIQLREAQRDVSRATEACEAAERREREFKTREGEFEHNIAQAQEGLTEVRAVMAQLRNALDESERQSSELEKERTETRKALQERETRLEKLQKSSKAMSEELRALQATNKLRQDSTQSSDRSSIVTTSPRVSSPSPKGPTSNGATAPVDTMYLKNILLQFLEQKEKKHQLQLVHARGAEMAKRHNHAVRRATNDVSIARTWKPPLSFHDTRVTTRLLSMHSTMTILDTPLRWLVNLLDDSVSAAWLSTVPRGDLYITEEWGPTVGTCVGSLTHLLLAPVLLENSLCPK